MSHTITFRISSKKLKEQKDLVNKLEQEVKDLIQKIKNNPNCGDLDLQDVLNRIQRFKQEIMWMNNAQYQNNIGANKTLSTFEKEVANLKYFVDLLNNKQDLAMFNFYAKQTNLANWITNYGLLAVQTLKEMYETKQPFSEQTFNQILERQRSLRLNDQERNELIASLNEMFVHSELSDNIKNKFKFQAMNLATNQELEDLNALVQTVINNHYTLKAYVQVLNQEFFDQGFSLDTTLPIHYDLDEHGLYVTYNLKNESNNTVQIKFYNTGEVSYKLGNYVGHACEKTTQDVFKGLESKGYDHEIISIQRNIDDAKPIKVLNQNKKKIIK